ncbi:DNA replication/repair protein RecF [Tahibacter amnicola]|uniref:DNA replication and repair protein RecF n=1 Tax=Tahibacter amnicola TaxID=2976241 RepID=A0ABY6BKU7_9GAMM|nr:DNA replication/repair protein RecF [Tahibacter amnicola]UXI68427.1 DNA replication/repair protein RecF [Tahibacter amnicola]
MRIRELRVENLRNISSASVSLGPGLNLFLGANGAGKTSLLEAAFLLSHARSFRSGKRESLVRRGAESLSVFAVVESGSRGERRVGLRRDADKWVGRVDGRNTEGLVELLREIAVVCFEPGSHGLIGGPGEERRRFLDWALFHVEQEFMDVARRYRRALKQRNSLLRRGVSGRDLDPWDAALADAGEAWQAQRERYVAAWFPEVETLCRQFLPELGACSLRLSSGWAAGARLCDVLLERRERDQVRGHTGAGPHRADWSISFQEAPDREHLSRGQEKLCAMACILAQARLFATQTGEWPVICLDDLSSELDAVHEAAVLSWLRAQGAQILLTGTDAPRSALPDDMERMTFHVEQGQFSALL